MLRHSEPLVDQPRVHTMERCTKVLCKSLGHNSSFDDVLVDYIAMFDGPLPKHIIAVLMAIFDIDINTGDDGRQLDGTLLAVVGDGITDLDDEVCTNGA